MELALILGRDLPGWEHAGPVRAVEHADHYTHDGAVSVSFVWAQAPRQAVPATVLDPLVRPGRYPRRVTCTYRPTPAAAAMDAATAQVRRRRLAAMVSALPVIGRAATAQDDRDAAAADQATREVADGAGWVAATITVTTTTHSPTPRRWRRRSPRPNTPPAPPSCGCGACTACRPPASSPGCPPGCP